MEDMTLWWFGPLKQLVLVVFFAIFCGVTWWAYLSPQAGTLENQRYSPLEEEERS
jgi:cbb3-type cytochrome oxidase subunit 3